MKLRRLRRLRPKCEMGPLSRGHGLDFNEVRSVTTVLNRELVVDYKDVGMPGAENHNGKNREQGAGAAGDAVAGPLAARPDLPYAYVAPQTVLQEVLLTVWTSILNIDKIGIEGRKEKHTSELQSLRHLVCRL